MIQLEDPRRKQRTNRVPAKHAKEEDGNTSSQFPFRVPGREGVDGAWDISGLAEAEEQSGDEEPGLVSDKDLETRDQTKGEHLARDPLPRSDPLEQHVGGDLEHDDAHEHELVAQVDGPLADVDVAGETPRQSAGYVHAVELKD